MAGRRKTLVLTDLRGGVNQLDPPTEVPDHQMAYARNVEIGNAGLCQKRRGVATCLSGLPLVSYGYLYQHVPAGEDAAELWGFSAPAGYPRRVVGSSISTPGGDTVGTATAMSCASLNGKLIIASNVAYDHMHVWDGSTIREFGLPVGPNYPTTSLSSGAVTDTRKYRLTACRKSGGILQVRSDAGAASGPVTLASQRCTVGLPLAFVPTSTVTHWEVWAASSVTNYTVYYWIGEAEIATGTIEDNVATLTDGAEILPEDGWNAQPPCAKFLLSDDNRIVMAGDWRHSTLGSRVWFTPVLGSSAAGEEERVPNTTTLKSYLDVNPSNGGVITGLGGPLADAIYVFKESHTYKLIKTGQVTTPYRMVPVSHSVGCLNHRSIVRCEDASGAPAMYFLSRRGPYRVGPNGMEYIGLDIEPAWDTVQPTSAHGVYYAPKKQVWWWILGASSSLLLVFDTRIGIATANGVRGGWQIADGQIASAVTSSVYFNTPSAPVPSDVKPVFMTVAMDGVVSKADADGVYSDGLTPYTSTFTTKTVPAGGYDRFARSEGLRLVCRPQTTSADLTIVAEKDFGTDSATYRVTVPTGNTSRVVVDAPDAGTGNLGAAHATTMQWTVTDEGRTDPWQLDALVCELAMEESR